jgi:hypothetical protein
MSFINGDKAKANTGRRHRLKLRERRRELRKKFLDKGEVAKPLSASKPAKLPEQRKASTAMSP